MKSLFEIETLLSLRLPQIIAEIQFWLALITKYSQQSSLAFIYSTVLEGKVKLVPILKLENRPDVLLGESVHLHVILGCR